jgi:hypothetical protein
VIKRKISFLKVNEYWFDNESYYSDRSDIIVLRTNDKNHKHDCLITERTLVIDLRRDPDELLQNCDQRCRHSISSASKKIYISLARSEDREIFYQNYSDFAKKRRLLVPYKSEEEDTDIFVGKSSDGNPVHFAAFIGNPSQGIYRYRYSLAISKSQSNAALIWAAITHAKNNGYSTFDLGGISRRISPELHGINNFKLQFGGKETDFYVLIRSSNPVLRLLLRGAEFLLRNEITYRKLTHLLSSRAQINIER